MLPILWMLYSSVGGCLSHGPAFCILPVSKPGVSCFGVNGLPISKSRVTCCGVNGASSYMVKASPSLARLVQAFLCEFDETLQVLRWIPSAVEWMFVWTLRLKMGVKKLWKLGRLITCVTKFRITARTSLAVPLSQVIFPFTFLAMCQALPC